MRALIFLTRRLNKPHRVLFLPHRPNTTSILNPYIHSNYSYQKHFIAAFYQPCYTPYITNTFRQHKTPHQLIKLPDFDEYMNQSTENDQIDQLGINEFTKNIQKAKEFTSGDEAISFLDDFGIKPNEDFIFLTICALREEWKLAFLVFKWGQKFGCSTKKTWHFLVWLLGNHQKFSTAWSVIYDSHRASMDTKQAILILIDRYTAANCPGKAIETFQAMDMFGFSPDLSTFLTFLNILCKHGNVEEAEQYMLLNKRLFPLESQSFNIILNGWCNLTVDIFEAKRIWREMLKNCVEPDEVTYVHMISCFSKVGNLSNSLRLYDEMLARGWIPCVEVYNSLIYVLTLENCLNEALKIVDKMKATGLQPDCCSFNSMILPLCEAMKSEEAKTVLAMMIEEGVGPTIDTYHAFVRNANLDTTMEVLIYMKKASLGPTSDTFVLVINNFFKLKQAENALKIWEEMDKYNIIPQPAHYNAMVEGLVEELLLIDARRFYVEMIVKGMIVNPKFQKLLAKPVEDNSNKKEGRKVSSTRHIRRLQQRHFLNNSFHKRRTL